MSARVFTPDMSTGLGKSPKQGWNSDEEVDLLKWNSKKRRSDHRGFVGESSRPRFHGDVVSEPLDDGQIGHTPFSFRNMSLDKDSHGEEDNAIAEETNSNEDIEVHSGNSYEMELDSLDEDLEGF